MKNITYRIILGISGLIILLPIMVFGQADKIYENNIKAVVVVFNYNDKNEQLGLGSGFFVHKSGAIVTNYHVIENGVFFKVKLDDNSILNVENVLYIDKINDIVILKVVGKDFPIVTLGDSDKVKPGEKVFPIGCPQGFEKTISDGVTSGMKEMPSSYAKVNRKVLQISAPTSPGSSGGPIFNEKGEVIAVHVAGFKDVQYQNINFSVPINFVRTRNDKLLSMEEAINSDCMRAAQDWLWKGNNLNSKGQYKEAIETYNKALRIYPAYVDVYDALALVYKNMGNSKMAIESFKEVIRLKPDQADAYYNLGLIYKDLEIADKAIEFLEKALRLSPDSQNISEELVSLYISSNKLDRAIELLEEILRLSPDSEMIAEKLASLYVSSKKFDKTIESYKQTISTTLNAFEAHYNLGHIYMKLADWQKAVESYKEAIRIKPNEVEVHNNQGFAYYKSQKYEEAIKSYNEAIRLKSDYASAHYNLGVTYYKTEKYEDAKKELETLKKLDKKLADKLAIIIESK